MPNFLIDDRPVDLSQFEGFTSEDIDETIMYLEEQERLRRLQFSIQLFLMVQTLVEHHYTISALLKNLELKMVQK